MYDFKSEILRTAILGVILAAGIGAAPATSAVALAEPAGWVGGLFGLSIPNYDNTSSRLMYGITGGAKVGTELGLGAYYLTSSKDEDAAVAGGAKQPFNYDMFGIEFAYHFEGEAKGVYVGGRLGTSKIKAGSPVSYTTSPVHYGAVGGYNKFLGENFSLGGEFNFMSVPESSVDVNGTSQKIKAFSMLNFLFSAKLWF